MSAPSAAAPLPSTQAAAAEATSTKDAEPVVEPTAEPPTAPAEATNTKDAEPSTAAAPVTAEEQDCDCGPSTSAPTSSDLPTAADLVALDELPVLDGAGKSISFRDVYAARPEHTQHLVVFLRHFLCGNCQEYVRHLAHHLPPSALPANTGLTLISCGAANYIGPYTAATDNPFPLLTDPTGATYEALKLARSLNPGARPEYIRQSLASTVVSGVAMGVAMGRDAMRSGEHNRIGGEFLFRREGDQEEWKVVWAHRMKNTRDHVGIGVLRDVLGMGSVEEGTAGAPADRKRGALDGWAEFKKWVGAKGIPGEAAASDGQQDKTGEGKGVQNGVENGVEPADKNVKS